MLLAEEVRHERVHTGGGEQHRGIVVGEKGFALNLGMAFGFEKLNVL
jgi:hypothetical protein